MSIRVCAKCGAVCGYKNCIYCDGRTNKIAGLGSVRFRIDKRVKRGIDQSIRNAGHIPVRDM